MSARIFPLPRPVQSSHAQPSQSPAQPLAAQLPVGRLIELVGGGASARLTTAVGCLRMAQLRGETTAWVQRAGGSLFPPDLHDSGVDLDALVVVQVPLRAGAHGPVKAAELLLRSGGFGMVVVDLSAEPRGSALERDSAWQGRLCGMAREHGSWIVLLGPDGARRGVFGPLVSLCLEPRRQRVGPGAFTLEPHVLKDKSGLLGPLLAEPCQGPAGVV
jgi:recombination protein RecA